MSADRLVRIPLVAGDKNPLVVRWSKLAPEDPIWADTFAAHPECNVGLRLDDLVVVDCDSPARVAWWLEQGYPTDFKSCGRPDRRSFWYRRPDDSDLETKRFADWEVRTGPGAQCVVPPSVHPLTHKPYQWLGPPVDEEHWWELPLAPVEALEGIVRDHKQPRGGVDGWDVILDGEGRDNFLTSVGGLLRARGASAAAIRDVLGAVNQLVCVPPLPAPDVDRIARSVSRYDAAVTYTLADGPDWSPWEAR